MTKKYFLQIALLMLCFPALSQEFRVISNTPGNIVLENETPAYIMATKPYNGVQYQDFSNVAKILMMEKDAPALPVFAESLVIPNTGDINLEITYDNFTEYDNVYVLPSKGSLKRNVNPANIPYAFGPKYNEDAFFPGQLAVAGNPYVFRQTRGVTVSFYPYQYNPVTHKLRVYHNINVKVISTTTPGANERQAVTNPSENGFFTKLYKNHYANMPSYEMVGEEGDMLIIAPDDYISAMTPLANWKKQKGIRTTIATLSQTGSSPESIKEYILDFYSAHPNLAYVLLAGDHEDLPCYSYGNNGEELYSDSYYGQLEGDDLYPELLVGRFSGTVDSVQMMVDKTLQYEVYPLAESWMTNAIGIASNEGDGIGDDNEPDWQHLRNIGDKLNNYGYNTVYEFFDGTHGVNDLAGSPTPTMISNAINAGVGLLNYTGHGAADIMVTGNYTNQDVQELQNLRKYPFVISVACNNGTFVGGTSLCEAFMNRSYMGQPAGAIASAGSSILMAWAEPMQTQDEMTDLITRSDSDISINTLGGLFYNGQISMLEAYNQSATAEEVMQTWVLFGDPSVLFRNQVSIDITGNHEEELPQSGGTINIVSNTSGASVVITQDLEVVAIGETVDGLAVIDIPALTSTNELSVALIKPNTRPYLGTVLVTSLGVQNHSSFFAVYPNPASEAINIVTTGSSLIADIALTDMNGRTLITEKQVDLAMPHSISTASLATGIYLLSVESGGKKDVKKIVIR